MKGIYRADPTTHVFVSSDVVADDYVLKANETFENPSGKQSPAKLQGMSWVDATLEEHEAYVKAQQAEFESKYPSQPAKPDQGGQALNLLGQQIAQMKAQQETMASSINALGQMIANQKNTTQPQA